MSTPAAAALAAKSMRIRLLAAAGPCFNRPVGGLVYHQGGSPEQWLATIGDISFSQHWVATPTGTYPIKGTVWTVTDMSHLSERGLLHDQVTVVTLERIFGEEWMGLPISEPKDETWQVGGQEDR